MCCSSLSSRLTYSAARVIPGGQGRPAPGALLVSVESLEGGRWRRDLDLGAMESTQSLGEALPHRRISDVVHEECLTGRVIVDERRFIGDEVHAGAHPDGANGAGQAHFVVVPCVLPEPGDEVRMSGHRAQIDTDSPYSARREWVRASCCEPLRRQEMRSIWAARRPA